MKSAPEIEPAPAAGTPREGKYETLYVHVPFCASKCAYCAFYSIPGASRDLRRRWAERLQEEFAEFARTSAPLQSIYVGGGTPTLLDAAELRALFAGIRQAFETSPDAEISVECNPETLTPEKVDAMVGAGVNRVSLGIQTWLPRLRRVLGRSGAAAAAVGAVRMLRERGIDNLGADLIWSIPGQSLPEWRDDLRRTADLGVGHVSAYELTVEEGTRLAESLSREEARGVRTDAAGDPVEFWMATDEVLAEYGMRRYEVSNFAVSGRECRHNLRIWYGGTYAGCGPGAWSFDGVVRRGNPRDIEAWLAGASPEEDRLPREERAAEILAFGLRTVAGWAIEQFRSRTGFDPRELRGAEIEGLIEDGLLEWAGGCLRPTPRGLLFGDTVVERLL